MNEILACSATQQARLVRERKISSVELIDAHLQHLHPLLCGWVDKLEAYRVEGIQAFAGYWVELDRYRAEMSAPPLRCDPVPSLHTAGLASWHVNPG